MALTSASTYANALDQYLANSNWYGDATAAAARKEAIDWFIANPQSLGQAGRNVSFDLNTLADELKKVADFLESTNTAARARRRSFVQGRAV